MSKFIQIFLIIVIFAVFSAVIYQRTFNANLQNVSNISSGNTNFKQSGILNDVKNSSTIEPLIKIPSVAPKSPGEMKPKISSEADLFKQVKQLNERVKYSLDWVAAMKTGSGGGYPLIRWDLLSNADVHILNKLATHLKKALKDKDASSKLFSLINKGYQCNAVQATQQEIISKRISMDICSELEWFKVVQLAWPEVRSIMDIGANKGYLSSLFVALWGGNGLSVAPFTIFNLSNKLKSWKGSRSPGGLCKEGFNFGIPLYCGGKDTRDEGTGACSAVHEDLRVTSIDGSSYLRDTLSDMIVNEFPKLSGNASKVSSMWKYFNFAMSDVQGSVRFTKQSHEQKAGFEGGTIRDGTVDATTEEVQMTSVDAFLRENGMHIDLLKIATEGNENKVLIGANDTIRSSSLGVFTFEGGKGVTLSKEMLADYDALGFSCYSTSRAGLFKWSGGCMKEQNMGKGNIFCVSRQKAPMVALSFDILSFPALIETYLDSDNVDPKAHKKLVTDIQQAGTARNISSSDLVPIYVNIKPFCFPWPACVNKV